MRMKKDKRRPWRPACDASTALCRYVLDENFDIEIALIRTVKYDWEGKLTYGAI